jgi:hypothetical protein
MHGLRSVIIIPLVDTRSMFWIQVQARNDVQQCVFSVPPPPPHRYPFLPSICQPVRPRIGLSPKFAPLTQRNLCSMISAYFPLKMGSVL